MKKNTHQEFGSVPETVMYPILYTVLMWAIYLVQQTSGADFYTWGILPNHGTGLKGILFAPLLHSPNDIMHIVNNSFPTLVLMAALIYFYRKIATQVFFLSWLLTGFFVWAFAEDNASYHIGMSGVIYALAGFLFVSGTLRKYRPLQGISLCVVFMYGSMIWGIFPLEERVSWESHLFGMVTGIMLAFLYKKQGPQAPKYQYEIEKEMGIEPPDLEGEWLERIRQAEEREEMLRQQQQQASQTFTVFYDFKPKNEVSPSPPDEKHPPQSPDL